METKFRPPTPKSQLVRTTNEVGTANAAASPASFDLPYSEIGDVSSSSTYGTRFVPSNT